MGRPPHEDLCLILNNPRPEASFTVVLDRISADVVRPKPAIALVQPPSPHRRRGSPAAPSDAIHPFWSGGGEGYLRLPARGRGAKEERGGGQMEVEAEVEIGMGNRGKKRGARGGVAGETKWHYGFPERSGWSKRFGNRC
jgi:hypothetical protein